MFFAAVSPTQNVVVTISVRHGYGPPSFRSGPGSVVDGPNGVIGPYGEGISGEKGWLTEIGLRTEGILGGGVGEPPLP